MTPTITPEEMATLQAANEILDRLYKEATDNRFRDGKSIPKEVYWNKIDQANMWLRSVINFIRNNHVYNFLGGEKVQS